MNLAVTNLWKVSLRLLLLYFSTFFILGCSVSYYDKQSETLHVIGFSHVKMKVPEVNKGHSVYHQVNAYGVAGGTLREGGFFSIGYSQNTILDMADDQVLCFVWPTSNLMDVKLNYPKPELLNGVCNDLQIHKNN